MGRVSQASNITKVASSVVSNGKSNPVGVSVNIYCQSLSFEISINSALKNVDWTILTDHFIPWDILPRLTSHTEQIFSDLPPDESRRPAEEGDSVGGDEPGVEEPDVLGLDETDQAPDQ